MGFRNCSNTLYPVRRIGGAERGTMGVSELFWGGGEVTIREKGVSLRIPPPALHPRTYEH